MMKRSTLKLKVCRETLRVLTSIELVHVAGGNPDARVLDTGNAGTTCPNLLPLASAGPGTGCPLPGKP